MSTFGALPFSRTFTLAKVALGGCPVFHRQVRNSSELPRIVRDRRQGETAGMRSNKQVVGTDHHPTYLQLGTNLRIMRSRFVGEIEKLDITQKGVEGRLTLLPPRRLFNAAPSAPTW